VGLVDTFVSEVLADLEYSWKTSDEESFQEELRRNPHEK
jgi:hypothetical protein